MGATRNSSHRGAEFPWYDLISFLLSLPCLWGLSDYLIQHVTTRNWLFAFVTGVCTSKIWRCRATDPGWSRPRNGVPWPVTFQLDQAIFQFQLHHGRPFSRASTRFRPLVSSFQGRNQDQLAADATDTIGSFFSATRHLQLTSSSQMSKGAAHRMKVLVS